LTTMGALELLFTAIMGFPYHTIVVKVPQACDSLDICDPPNG